jgi:UDP-N-acetylglucosamine/UDP-N-acetylgalactosamine diphosphorylase
MAEKAKTSSEHDTEAKPETTGRNEFHEKFAEIEGLFTGRIQDIVVEKYRDDFLSVSDKARSESGAGYIAVIQGLPAQVSGKGTLWLQRIVDALCEKTKTIMPSLNLFEK